MTHPDLHFYSPKAESKTEHPLWINGDPAFLKALQEQLIRRFNGRYPTFIFVVRDNALNVQVHLDGDYKAFRPGEYSPDFNRFLDFCGGFELGWMAARATT